jgi:DNA polymerase III sliding clamp (beta) subunit (PCNA family)
MKFEISAPEMARLLGGTHRSICKDVTREQLCRLMLSVDGEQLIAVATDGHRLAKYATKCLPHTDTPDTCLISLAVVKDLYRAIKKMKGGVVIVDTSDRSIRVSGGAKGGFVFNYPAHDGVIFPPYRQVIPQMEGDREGVRYMAVNPVYLADAGAAFSDASSDGWKEPTLRMEFGGELDPILLTDPQTPELTMVVMPMRIGSPGYAINASQDRPSRKLAKTRAA